MNLTRLAVLFALGTNLVACGDASPGKAVDPDEKKACAEVGNRVTATGIFLAGEPVFCGDKGECNGYLVAEVGPTTQGIAMKRLQATASIGEGKNQLKAIPASGGSNWRLTSVHDTEGKVVSQPAKFSGKLKKGDDDHCVLAIDRIDSPTAAPAASGSK